MDQEFISSLIMNILRRVEVVQRGPDQVLTEKM